MNSCFFCDAALLLFIENCPVSLNGASWLMTFLQLSVTTKQFECPLALVAKSFRRELVFLF